MTFKTYIVEHLDEELGPWSELEYITIARESQETGSKFFLSSLHPQFKVPEALAAIPSFTAERRGVEELYADKKSRVCLLDPQGKSDLAPEDADNFDVFLFGGILGDDPPRDRTSELRAKGFEGRRLGPVQMTTDTAVRVTRLVVEGKTPLKDIPYVDFPELKFNEYESTEMPFRYVKTKDGNPIMPEPPTMSKLPPPIKINPPLINSANPWASNYKDLEKLYLCPSTGAVTTRTATLLCFKHDDAIHRYTFFNPSTHQTSETTNPTHQQASQSPSQTASLNTLGYSPYPLIDYLKWIRKLTDTYPKPHPAKPFIISVTGDVAEMIDAYSIIAGYLPDLVSVGQVYMEINLSCPNIPNNPPPAYSKAALVNYLRYINLAIRSDNNKDLPRLPFGIKTPPYTHFSEYTELISALEEAGDQLSFISCTNTLGSCLVLSPDSSPVLPGNGIGGMAGAALHPLALGNVATIRRMLDESEGLRHVIIIGIGGVEDEKGYRRMRAAGAGVVGVGTALGWKGVEVFRGIEEGLKGEW
ncbi:hypothetical protein QBC36DRAFT_384275 [Triangularia setosa]|uniref:Dihydroorotate dehydrogenase catalytic domain-containing protein n=1 Tax=Triangularia setosa TaxID=2587417 RepID=A0AAN7ABN7_9PEZI|nr:hypothetical protein QBC36DRAFT_384275 [Podospora setosa]